MRRARFIGPARREYLAQAIHYNREQPGLGATFTAAVEAAIRQIVAHPLCGLPMRGDTRRVLVRTFPFSIVYRVEDEHITIVALAHLARNPGYWLPRVQEPLAA